MIAGSRELFRVPFSDLWKMRIEHPYSLLVRAGNLAWTCGQCPLSADGFVLAPEDLGGQAEHVGDYIRRVLDSTELSAANVGKLVLYHVPLYAKDAGRMLSHFRAAFPNAILIPVGIPFFYYPGMRLEVDACAAGHRSPVVLRRNDALGLRLQVVDASELIWMSLELLANPDGTETRGTLDFDVVHDTVRAAVGLATSALLADHWFVSGDGASSVIQGLWKAGLVSDPGTAVRATLPPGVIAIGELTFAKVGEVGEVERSVATSSKSGTSIRARSSRHHFCIAGRSVFPELSLVDETKTIMAAIAETMSARGWSFDTVCKATTHYVGSSAAEDLHANMKIRNAYYRRPGPASTGLPVTAFPFSSSKIAIDVFGVIT